MNFSAREQNQKYEAKVRKQFRRWKKILHAAKSPEAAAATLPEKERTEFLAWVKRRREAENDRRIDARLEAEARWDDQGAM